MNNDFNFENFKEFSRLFLNSFNDKYSLKLLKKFDRVINNRRKKVLLVCHEFSLTGAPVAIMYFAKALKKLGYLPVVVSPKIGDICIEYKKLDIPALVYPQIFSENLHRDFVKLFDYVVACTIVCAPFVKKIMHTHMDILWWIHEAEYSYTQDNLIHMPKKLLSNVHVFVGGSYAKKVLEDNFPEYRCKELLYYTPKVNKNYGVFSMPKSASGKTVFCSVGTLEKRKGHEILVQAIRDLSIQVMNKCFFVIVGSKCYQPSFEAIQSLIKDFPNSILYMEKLRPNDLQQLYMQIDCLICSSTDDPMPIVVTDALMNKKLVICSENTGSALILKKEKVGFVYHNNSPKELAEKIEFVFENKDKFDEIRKNSYMVYERYFSEKVFESSVKNIFKGLENEKHRKIKSNVSVVIPVFNGGEQLKCLVKKLNDQINVKKLEIVVVDSGSTDDSCQICKENSVKLIQIPQSEFTHSHARNLGAENASGDIIVFMTQDALPIGNTWIQEITAPIILREAVAVSCKEQCPDNVDLYYKILSTSHCNFIGIVEGNVLNEINDADNGIELRKKASLNDVSLAIDKYIFMQYKYRFDYAEDLDMGLRLLNSGYRIKLLSKTCVLHGHNRNKGYYLKRGYVEQFALKKIDESFAMPQTSAVFAYSVMLGTYLKIQNSVKIIKRLFTSEIAKNLFLEKLDSIFSEQEELPADFKQIEKTGDSVFDDFVEIVVAKLSDGSDNIKMELCEPIMGYLKTLLIPFIKKQQNEILSIEQQDEILDCIWKQFSLYSGNLIGSVSTEDNSFISDFDFLRKGV